MDSTSSLPGRFPGQVRQLDFQSFSPLSSGAPTGLDKMPKRPGGLFSSCDRPDISLLGHGCHVASASDTSSTLMSSTSHTSSTATSSTGAEHLQISYSVICAGVLTQVLTEFLHRSSCTGVLTEELLHRSCYTGVATQELLHRSSLLGDPIVKVNSWKTTLSQVLKGCSHMFSFSVSAAGYETIIRVGRTNVW